MNRNKQKAKDIANKHAQEHEEYLKNKALLKESIVKEKIDDSIHLEESDSIEENLENPTDKTSK